MVLLLGSADIVQISKRKQVDFDRDVEERSIQRRIGAVLGVDGPIVISRIKELLSNLEHLKHLSNRGKDIPETLLNLKSKKQQKGSVRKIASKLGVSLGELPDQIERLYSEFRGFASSK
ncbi:MAG: hypothetical protein ACTSUE_00830 [Promethearchaeota archaeon]